MLGKDLSNRRGLRTARQLSITALLIIGLVSVQTVARDFVFSGHVYQGSPPDMSHPARGVVVELYGDEDDLPQNGQTFLATATSNEAGEFRLVWIPKDLAFAKSGEEDHSHVDPRRDVR